MEFVLITKVDNDSDHEALTIVPLTPAFLDYLSALVGHFAAFSQTVPELEQFRTRKTGAWRIINDGPHYRDLRQAVEDEDGGFIVRPFNHRLLQNLHELPTHFLDLIVRQDSVALLGDVIHDKDQYCSAFVQPTRLRQAIADWQA